MEKNGHDAEEVDEGASSKDEALAEAATRAISNAIVEKISKLQVDFSKLGAAYGGFLDGLAGLFAPGGVIREAAELRKKTYPLMAQKLSTAANHCWFLTPDVDLQAYEKQAISIPLAEADEDVKSMDELFIDFYSGWFNYLCNRALKLFPHREFALKPAFSAHERGEYALSVPVFFAQADGIVAEVATRELFTKRGHISEYAKEKIRESAVEGGLIEAMDLALWISVSECRPVGWAEKERKKAGYKGLNRNTVMHGIDLSYATLTNSLKAFSLLAYIVGMEDLLREDPSAPANPNNDTD